MRGREGERGREREREGERERERERGERGREGEGERERGSLCGVYLTTVTIPGFHLGGGGREGSLAPPLEAGCPPLRVATIHTCNICTSKW